MSDQKPDYVIMPGEGSHLIFVTEEDPGNSRTAVWLVPHDNDEPKGDLSVLSDRDITVLGAFLSHAASRVAEETHRRYKERETDG